MVLCDADVEFGKITIFTFLRSHHLISMAQEVTAVLGTVALTYLALFVINH